MTMRATCNGVVITESDHTVTLEGRKYLPSTDGDHRHVEPSSHRSTCCWKGRASYFDVVADGQRGKDAAWFYPAPSAVAWQIAGHIAFWKGVAVRDASVPEPARVRWGRLKRSISS
jgi:uncharacterized protein (DUF427 family)